jgi:hypothetical protein
LTAASLARISAPAPSLVCAAVARRHAAARGKHRAQLGQALERGIGARAFVEVTVRVLAIRLAGLARLAGRGLSPQRA